MSIQMNLLGGLGTSRITAQAVSVSAIRLNSCSAGILFTSAGQQITQRNTSNSIEGNWVVPAFSASEWEIRAVLDSGTTPTGSVLGSWLPLSVDQSWELVAETPGAPLECLLTFEFRRVGGTVAETTVSGNSIYAEALGGF